MGVTAGTGVRDARRDRLSLGEGNTPLVASRLIATGLGVPELHFKLECNNPTGSFKDRFAAAEVRAMIAAGQRACLATSSGNTGSALAAYCARYGLMCHLFVTQETPLGKILQARAYGTRVYRVTGYGSDPRQTAEIDEVLAGLARENNFRFVISAFRYCPDSMDELGTASAEIVEQLGAAPDHVLVPVGGGGLLTALWRGFNRLYREERIDRLPKVHGVQPAGNPTVYAPWSRGERTIHPVESTTRISGLIVPFDVDASLALGAIYESGGRAIAVSDEAIWEAQRNLAIGEGIYAEPAGAASVAGLNEAVRSGWIARTDRIVCFITGHGFKDLSSVESNTRLNPATLVSAHAIASLIFPDPESPAPVGAP